MAQTLFRVARYERPDRRTGFVIEENGQQWPRLFRSRAEAAAEMRRFRIDGPLAAAAPAT